MAKPAVGFLFPNLRKALDVAAMLKINHTFNMKSFFLSSLLFLVVLNLKSQTLRDTILVQQRSYYLNGGVRANLGGKSRETIRINLPKNTKRWYYSFTTSPGEDGTKLLNLGVQVAASLTTGGLGSAIASSIQVPAGSSTVDVYVLPIDFRSQFIEKQDATWKFYADVSVQNAKQAVQSIDNNYGNSFYIGLKNPSAVSGVNIQIEVAAIIEEINPDSDKGKLYESLAKKSYERGEFDKSLEYNQKALLLNPNLSSAKFNIALIHLQQDKDQALEEYVNAISDSKKDSNPKLALFIALQDLRNLKAKLQSQKNIKDIEDLLTSELKKY